MQGPFAGVPSDAVEKREVKRVVLGEGCIRVGRARASGVSFFSFFFFFVLTVEFASV